MSSSSETPTYGSVVLRPTSKSSLHSVIAAAKKVNELEEKFAKRRSQRENEPQENKPTSTAPVIVRTSPEEKPSFYSIAKTAVNVQKFVDKIALKTVDDTAPTQLNELQQKLARQKVKLESTIIDEVDHASWKDVSGDSYVKKVEIDGPKLKETLPITVSTSLASETASRVPSFAPVAKAVVAVLRTKNAAAVPVSSGKSELELAFERRKTASVIVSAEAAPTLDPASDLGEKQLVLEQQRSEVTVASSGDAQGDNVHTPQKLIELSTPPHSTPSTQFAPSSRFQRSPSQRPPSQREINSPSELQLKERQKVLVEESSVPDARDITTTPSSPVHDSSGLDKVGEFEDDKSPLNPGLKPLGGLLDGLSRGGIVSKPSEVKLSTRPTPQVEAVSPEERGSSRSITKTIALSMSHSPSAILAADAPTLSVSSNDDVRIVVGSPLTDTSTTPYESPKLHAAAPQTDGTITPTPASDSPIIHDGLRSQSELKILISKRLSSGGVTNFSKSPVVLDNLGSDDQPSEIRDESPHSHKILIPFVNSDEAIIPATPVSSGATENNASIPATPQTASATLSLPASPDGPTSGLVVQSEPVPTSSRGHEGVPASLEKVFSTFAPAEGSPQPVQTSFISRDSAPPPASLDRMFSRFAAEPDVSDESMKPELQAAETKTPALTPTDIVTPASADRSSAPQIKPVGTECACIIM